VWTDQPSRILVSPTEPTPQSPGSTAGIDAGPIACSGTETSIPTYLVFADQNGNIPAAVGGGDAITLAAIDANLQSSNHGLQLAAEQYNDLVTLGRAPQLLQNAYEFTNMGAQPPLELPALGFTYSNPSDGSCDAGTNTGFTHSWSESRTFSDGVTGSEINSESIVGSTIVSGQMAP
jgi:hypothetical protein